ncbi:peroxin [Puccinia graminis f. sp. tritici]|uniref:Peroxin n=1 Tax=Puccinia graminis f. sp. tritici TaxID=56615 RepID=A0A5B0LZF5_PUCGR|nr:peroxin [Puccinia graminis f. sp. tritici]
MDYLSSLIQRSKRPMTIVASVFGGGYLAVSYLRSKLDEMQDSLTRTRACTENLRRRFEQNQDDCSFTVLALIPTLGKQVIQAMNVERLVEVLSQTKSRSTTQIGRSPSNQEKEPSIKSTPPPEPESIPNGDHSSEPHPSLENSITTSSSSEIINPLDPTPTERAPSAEPPASKPTTAPFPQDLAELLVRPDGTVLQKRSEIWREMMVVSFTRLFTCLYGVSLLTLQTHVQLGLLGRDAYLSSILSVEKRDESEEELRDDEQGWLVLARRTRIAVVDALASRNLKDFVAASDLLEIFDLVRKKVELEADGSQFNFAPILLPTNESDEIRTLEQGGMSSAECQIDERLRKLLDETQDFIDCPDFRLVLSNVMTRILDLCLSNLFRHAQLDPPQLLPSLPRFSELQAEEACPPSSSTRFVDILPIISKESLEILNVIPNEYIQTIGDTSELKEFSSVIYTTFDRLTESD